MNTHLTEIVYILDRSGSMQPMQESAIAAIVKARLDVPDDSHLSLIQFDDAYEVPIATRPVQDRHTLRRTLPNDYPSGTFSIRPYLNSAASASA